MQGILVVNKEEGYTSHDIVNLVRRAFHIKKVGHTGTLDPMATGVLPICIGKATKVASYIQGDRKIYVAKALFGTATDTLDREGKITETSDVIPTMEDFQKVIPKYLGEISQIPPMYSAIKVEGKKLYELARAGVEIERKPRKVRIYRLAILSYENHVLTFEVECSSGTYIRTLADDIGRQVGSVCHLISLCRTATGNFTLEETISTTQLKKENVDVLLEKLLPIDRGLTSLEKIVIDKKDRGNVSVGKKIPVNFYLPGELRVYGGHEFLGIGRIIKEGGRSFLHVHKVLTE